MKQFGINTLEIGGTGQGHISHQMSSRMWGE